MFSGFHTDSVAWGPMPVAHTHTLHTSHTQGKKYKGVVYNDPIDNFIQNNQCGSYSKAQGGKNPTLEEKYDVSDYISSKKTQKIICMVIATKCQ